MSFKDRRTEVVIEIGAIRPNKVLFTEFTKSEDSVFEDGYDHSAEALIVAELIKEPNNKEHPRVLDFEHRMVLLKARIKYLSKDKTPLDKIVLDDYKVIAARKKGASRVPRMKSLVPSNAATITLHTAEAVSILEGVKKSPDKFGFPGLKSAGSAVKDLYYLSADNNPLADLALLQFEQDISIVSNMIQGKTAKYKDMLDQEEKNGLSLPILVSAEPMSFPVDFGSQYSVAIGRLILMYDYVIRVILTVTNAGLIRRSNFVEERKEIRRHIIRTSQEVCKFRRLVSHDAVRTLRPESWLNETPNNVKLLTEVTKAFGKIPLDVLIGKKLPNYSSRNPVDGSKMAEYENAIKRVNALVGEAQVDSIEVENV